VTVCARRADEAAKVAHLAGASVRAWPAEAGSWDVLINATPVGTFPHVRETPFATGQFTGQLVYDLVYNPPETRLVREASAAGLRTIGGLDMLVAQAQQQFEWWTGIRPAARVMRNAALASLDAMQATERI
jgi:shikimate 5-dehydrogenase